jgi:hypothetical protein
MLSVIMLSVIMLSVIMLSVIMLSAIMLSVTMLIAVEPNIKIFSLLGVNFMQLIFFTNYLIKNSQSVCPR